VKKITETKAPSLDLELIQIEPPEYLFLYLFFPYLIMGMDKLILLILKV